MKTTWRGISLILLGSAMAALAQSGGPTHIEQMGFVFGGRPAVVTYEQTKASERREKKDGSFVYAIVPTLAAKARDPRLSVGTSFTTTPDAPRPAPTQYKVKDSRGRLVEVTKSSSGETRVVDTNGRSSETRPDGLGGYETRLSSGVTISIAREGPGWRATDSLGNGWTITPDGSGSYRTTLYTKGNPPKTDTAAKR